MEKLKYALYHGKYFLIFLLIGIYFLTSFVLNTLAQLNSAKNGIEMLFIDTSLSSGSPDSFASTVKKTTGVKYVSASTLATSDALEYIKTIDNYSFTDYLAYLAEVKENYEKLFADYNASAAQK